MNNLTYHWNLRGRDVLDLEFEPVESVVPATCAFHPLRIGGRVSERRWSPWRGHAANRWESEFESVLERDVEVWAYLPFKEHE
jgi:hypothetical protein